MQVNKVQGWGKKPPRTRAEALRLQCPLVPTASSCWVPSRGGVVNGFWFHRGVPTSYLLCSSIIMCRSPMSQKETTSLSSNSSSACPSPAPVKALGTTGPAQRRMEREGRGRAVSRPAVWHSPAGSSGSLPSASFQVTSINILSHPCQVPFGPHVHPQPPLPWVGQLSSNKCFISSIDGYLGIAALLHTRLNIMPI